MVSHNQVCSVAGADSATGGTSYYDGMSLGARLYFVDIFGAGGSFAADNDLTSLWDTVHLGRGRHRLLAVGPAGRGDAVDILVQ